MDTFFPKIAKLGIYLSFFYFGILAKKGPPGGSKGPSSLYLGLKALKGPFFWGIGITQA